MGGKYAREYRLDEIDEDQLKILEDKAKMLLNHIDAAFLQRYMRTRNIKMWKRSMKRLEGVTKNFVVEQPRRVDLDAFVPPRLRPFVTFLNKVS